MKKLIMMTVLLFCGSMSLFAEDATVKFISIDEFKKLIEANDGLAIVDVLGKESYKNMHVKGAINIPLAELGEKKNLEMLKAYKTIVVYCAHSKCHASVKAAELLMQSGFTNVLDFKGGIKEWSEAKMPVESGMKCECCPVCKCVDCKCENKE